jgi:hypothetical protein
MADERAFAPRLPAGAEIGWDKPRYTGYRNYIDTAYRTASPPAEAIVLYDDTGEIVHRFDSIGGGGHYDYSGDGKLAYFKLPTAAATRGGAEAPLEIHVVNIDGSGDRTLFSLPRAQCRFQNLHLAWPARVGDWFVASFFPSTPAAPDHAAPFDEILQLRLDGQMRYLAHSGTVYSRSGNRGGAGDMFWAQPLARPSADGKRICFNSNRSGTVDLHILYPQGQPPPAPRASRP